MSELRKDIKDLAKDDVIRFDGISTQFLQNKNLLLISECIRNIESLLSQQGLNLLSRDKGLDCQFMGDGVGTWRKAKLSISIGLTIEDDENSTDKNTGYEDELSQFRL